MPFRKVFVIIDGETRGPNLYGGDIGRQLNNCETNPITSFNRIKINPTFKRHLETIVDIGSDQKYLRDIIIAIDAGIVNNKLANRSPGKLGYARWLTTANRILRVYVSSQNTTQALNQIVNFIISIYARSWFAIKSEPLFTKSPQHIFNMIQWIKEMNSDEIKNVCFRTISQNAYSLHTENILLAMISDPRPSIRCEGINRIIHARTTNNNVGNGIRKFIKPNINVDAEDYYQLVDYNNSWLESILTEKLTLNQLLHAKETFEILELPNYPSHTQAVERVIRLISETSTMSACKNQRDARIRITLETRKIMPCFNSKQDFK